MRLKIAEIMETKASRKLDKLLELPKIIPAYVAERYSYIDALKSIFTNKTYVRRFIVLVPM